MSDRSKNSDVVQTVMGQDSKDGMDWTEFGVLTFGE